MSKKQREIDVAIIRKAAEDQGSSYKRAYLAAADALEAAPLSGKDDPPVPAADDDDGDGE